MEKYELGLNDIDINYFHFTKRLNIESIEVQGLIPKKGEHAKYIEKSEKVFFVQGLDNLLILFDCWINVYKNVPLLPKGKLVYRLGSKAMQSKCFPMFLVDLYFRVVKNSKRHKVYAYKVFDQLLEECILLNLNIQEGEDFSLLDIDEIKAAGYRKRHLVALGYSELYSDMNSIKMDKWNLHTFPNKMIENNKIKLCVLNNTSNIKDIFLFVLENTHLDLEKKCPTLYDYIRTNKIL